MDWNLACLFPEKVQWYMRFCMVKTASFQGTYQGVSKPPGIVRYTSPAPWCVSMSKDFSTQQSQQEKLSKSHPVVFLRCSFEMLFYIFYLLDLLASKHRDKATTNPIKHLHSYLDSLTGRPRWTGDFIRQRPCHGTASVFAGDHCPFPAVRWSLWSNQGPIIHMLHGICCLNLPIKTGALQQAFVVFGELPSKSHVENGWKYMNVHGSPMLGSQKNPPWN